MTKAKDFSFVVGKTYGFLVVQKLLPRKRNKRKRLLPATAECYCQICGSTTAQEIGSFVGGGRVSCGCIGPHSKNRTYFLAKAKEMQPTLVGENKGEPSSGDAWIVEKLHAKYICETPDETCLRSKLAQLCCWECDKRARCGKACKCTPDKCGAKERK